ncbi:MAG TPA: formimidoylglutamate deiminase [Crinalium sp.]|jgi:formimidoylglutamate deiminase
MKSIFAPLALLPQGWAENVCIEIDQTGFITAVTVNASEHHANRVPGPILPGMPNLHSHAFQRAMAGLAEGIGQGTDSFWGWRQVMYGFLDRLTPDQLEIIATFLYIEMLKAGFTAVAEFHYIHHDPQGQPYTQRSELSTRLIAAAQSAGIGLTLLPVLYAYSNFGGQKASTEQRRFITNADQFMGIWQDLKPLCDDQPCIRLGVAPHSLRAVTPALLMEVLTAVDQADNTAPIHIHLAEQIREVEDCIAWSGLRPVEWAIAHLPLSDRWCLVHATHMNSEECRQVAERGAIVGLCPTTEANLGDGVFPAVEYFKCQGQFGIGSDSNISVSPIEELRWLEYGQRLSHQRRGVIGSPNTTSLGEFLYSGAIAGGAKALGQPIGRLQPGYRADLVVLDPDLPTLLGASVPHLLNKTIFAGNQNPIRDVMTAGRWVVRDRHHPLETKIYKTYRDLLKQLQD